MPRAALHSKTLSRARSEASAEGGIATHAGPTPTSGSSEKWSTFHQPTGTRTMLMPCATIQSKCASETQPSTCRRISASSSARASGVRACFTSWQREALSGESRRMKGGSGMSHEPRFAPLMGVSGATSKSEALDRGTSRKAWSPPTPTYSGGFQPGARSRTEPLAAASLSGSHAKGARACEVLAAVLSPKPSPSPPTVATSALHTHRCSMPEGGASE